MKRGFLVAFAVVVIWMFGGMNSTSLVHAQVSCTISASVGAIPNQRIFSISSPVDGWHQVNFGNGASTDVMISGGSGSTWTNYDSQGGPYTVVVSGLASCQMVVIMSSDTLEIVNEETHSDGWFSPGCLIKPETQVVNVNGNHFTISAEILGEDKDWPDVDIFGVIYDRRADDNRIFVNGNVPLGEVGVFAVHVINQYTGQNCWTVSFEVSADNTVDGYWTDVEGKTYSF